MALDLVTVPCLEDNYAFLVHDTASGRTALFDAPEAAPIRAALAARGWRLTDIFITHHHGDHIDAVPDLASESGARVIGAARDSYRLPPLDLAVEPEDLVEFAGHDVRVIDVAGHTTGHVAYYLPEAHAAFTGDSLMALGCGRLFEGTPEMMWASLMRLAALPDTTLICSGHEYTTANGHFAITVEPENAALRKRIETTAVLRAAGRPTVPSTLALEKRTNPFLRASRPEVKSALRLTESGDAEVFAHIRKAKDNF